MLIERIDGTLGVYFTIHPQAINALGEALNDLLAVVPHLPTAAAQERADELLAVLLAAVETPPRPML